MVWYGVRWDGREWHGLVRYDTPGFWLLQGVLKRVVKGSRMLPLQPKAER
jgi:hypothetical protein